jgi:hypothetical protein
VSRGFTAPRQDRLFSPPHAQPARGLVGEPWSVCPSRLSLSTRRFGSGRCRPLLDAAATGSSGGVDRLSATTVIYVSSPTDNCSRSSAASDRRWAATLRHQLALSCSPLALARRHPRARHRRARRPPLVLPPRSSTNSIPMHKKSGTSSCPSKHWHQRLNAARSVQTLCAFCVDEPLFLCPWKTA